MKRIQEIRRKKRKCIQARKNAMKRIQEIQSKKKKCISIWENYRKVDTNEDVVPVQMYPCQKIIEGVRYICTGTEKNSVSQITQME